MSIEEQTMFNNIIKILNSKKKKDPMFYNNNNTKYLMKNEFNISNNVVKGIIMLNINEKYIIDIYLDNGTENIVNGLLDFVFDSYDDAVNKYNELISYLKENSLITILTDGLNHMQRYA
ncbi:MAG: hypothetical protein ACI31R_00330 [Bacilli bacterium]